MNEPRRHEDHEEEKVKYNFENLSKDVVDCCFQVHKKLGCGLLEEIYEEPLCIELENKGLSFELQKHSPIFYDGKKLNKTCRLDVVVENKIILELKAVSKLLPIHEAQILTYMRVTSLKIGFLVNFHEPYFKNEIRRFVL